jgi:O-antigen ligase
MPAIVGALTMLPTLVDLLLVGIVPAAFVFGLRAGLATLIIVRPLCDRLFELSRSDVGGVALSYGALLNLIVIFALLLNIGRVWRRAPSSLKTAWIPFLMVCSVGVLYSPVQVDAFRKLLTYVSFSSIFVLALAIVKSDRDVAFFLKLTILSSVLPVAYGLFQYATGVDFPWDSRIQSTFPHANILASYLVGVIGVILFLLASESIQITSRLRVCVTAYLIPLLVVLVLSQARGPWVGCFSLLLVYGLIYDRRILVFLLAAPLLASLIPTVNDRIADLTSHTDYVGGPGIELNAYAWRQLLWEHAWVWIWRQPIFGYGLDSFHFYSPQFFFEAQGVGAHSVYIQFIFELGFVGLTSLLWIFWRCFASILRYWRFEKRGATIAGAMMLVFLIFCYSDNIFEYVSFDWSFWFSSGLMLSHLAAVHKSMVRNKETRKDRHWSKARATGVVATSSGFRSTPPEL